MNIVLLVLCCIVVCIVVSYLAKVNMGILAGACAYVIGCFLLGMTPGELIALIPVRLLFTIFAITLFYGFALENGTLQLLIDHVLYRLRTRAFLTPVFIFLFSAGLGVAGVGAPSITAIVSPIAMAIALSAAGQTPVVILAAAVSYGACIGGNYIFSEGGVVSRALIESSAHAEHALRYTARIFRDSCVIYGAVFFAVYLVFKGHRMRATHHHRPAPFRPKQRATLLLILAVVLLVLSGALIDGPLRDTALYGVLGGRLDISFIMLVGGCAALLLRLADCDQVLKQRIPVRLLVMFGGVSLLMGVAREAGLIEQIGNLIEHGVPTHLIPCFLAVVAGFLSFFSSSTSVVVPMLFPVVPIICQNITLDPGVLYGAVFIGATSAGISPFSTGGSLFISNCPVEAEQNRLFYQLIMLSVANILVTAVYFFVLGWF